MILRAAEPLMIGELVSVNEAGLAIKGHQNPIGTAVTAAHAGGSVTVSERIPTSWREEPAERRNLGIIEMLRRIEAGEGALLPPAIEFEIDAEESYVAERTPQHPLHRLVLGLRRLGYDHRIDRIAASRSDVFRFHMDLQRHAENLRRHFGYPSPRGPSFYDEYLSAREDRHTFSPPFFADADAAVLAHRLAMANTGRFPRVDPTPRPSPPPVINPAPPPAAPQPLPYNPKGSRRISA